MRIHLIHARSARLGQLVMRGDQLFQEPGFRTIKSNGRTKAGILEVEGEGYVFIKRVRSHSWMAGAAGRLKPGRAQRAIAGAAMLEGAGLECPAVLAAAEAKRAGSVYATFLITEALRGAETFSRFAIAYPDGRRRDFIYRRGVLDAVAREVRRLHDAGLYTLDLQETNLMIERMAAGALKVYFVDLEDFRRVRAGSAVPERRRLLNLVHLDRSIGRFLSRAERLRFLSAYLGAAGARPERAEIRRQAGVLMRLRVGAERSSRARRRAAETRSADLAAPQAAKAARSAGRG